jgi:hypothetical protein
MSLSHVTHPSHRGPRSFTFARSLTAALGLVFSCAVAHATPTSPWLERLPAGGFLFAVQANAWASPEHHRFTIAEISASGLRTVLSEDHADYSDLLWLDFRRLVAVGAGPEREAFVQLYVDGKRDGERLVVPASTWALGKLEAPYSYEVYANKRGELRVGACMRQVERGYSSRCADYRTVAVDPFKRTVGSLQRKLPKGFEGHDKVAIPVAKMKTLAAPAGYSVALHKTDILDGSAMMGDGRNVPAFTCKGPSGSVTWPSVDTTNWEFITRPKSVRWVSHAPPIFVVEGPTTDPVGQKGTSRQLFVACSPEPMEDVIFGPHAVWLERVSDMDGVVIKGSHWVVRVGPVTLGEVVGGGLLVMAPE